MTFVYYMFDQCLSYFARVMANENSVTMDTRTISEAEYILLYETPEIGPPV